MNTQSQITALTRLVAALTDRVRVLEVTAKARKVEAAQTAFAAVPDVITMRAIAEAVAIGCGLTLADMRGPDRTQRTVYPRQKAFMICHRQGYSMPVIGRYFGGRDHTTVLYGIRKAESREKKSPQSG